MGVRFFQSRIISCRCAHSVSCTLCRNRPEEKQSTDLGVAPAKDGGVDVAVPTDEKDINAAYDVSSTSVVRLYQRSSC